MRRLGTTREDPIILDDSEAGTAAASPASTDDDLFEVDAYGNRALNDQQNQQPLTTRPRQAIR
jgi:hypothetical protein